MTYFSGNAAQVPGLAPFDGVALMSAVLPHVGSPHPAGLPIQSIASGISPLSAQPGVGQPSAEAIRQQAAAVIQRCYRWLEAAVPAVPQVAALVPALITAVQQYEAQQYGPCLQQTMLVAQTAVRVGAAVPALPPL